MSQSQCLAWGGVQLREGLVKPSAAASHSLACSLSLASKRTALGGYGLGQGLQRPGCRQGAGRTDLDRLGLEWRLACERCCDGVEMQIGGYKEEVFAGLCEGSL